jgi:hypothetical protein
MRSVCKLSLAVGVALLLAAPSLAQFRPQNPVKFLLDSKDFQKDLNLTEDQVKKATDAADEVFKKHADDFKDLDFRSEEGRAKMQEVNRKISKETAKAFEDILKPEQMKRLKQIELQSQLRFGVGAFNDSDLQASLKLTDEQKAKIKTISDDLRKEREELFKDVGMDPQKQREARQKMQGLNKEASDKVNKVLTADQKKLLDEMKGEEFKFPEFRPGGGARPPAN